MRIIQNTTNIIYSDLNQSNPQDQVLRYNLDAVYQSIASILSTRRGERLFNPNFGVDLEDYLFDLIDPITATAIFREVSTALEEFEPRVDINYSESQVIPLDEENTYVLNLVFSIKGLSGKNFNFTGNFKRDDI